MSSFEWEAISSPAKLHRWHRAEPITFIKSCTWQEQVLCWRGLCVRFNLLDDLARQTFSIDACSCLMLSSWVKAIEDLHKCLIAAEKHKVLKCTCAQEVFSLVWLLICLICTLYQSTIAPRLPRSWNISQRSLYIFPKSQFVEKLLSVSFKAKSLNKVSKVSTLLLSRFLSLKTKICSQVSCQSIFFWNVVFFFILLNILSLPQLHFQENKCWYES